MAIGVPVLVPHSDEDKFIRLQPISFSRQDSESFDENLLQRIVDEVPEILPVRDFYPSTKSVRSLGREIPVDLIGRDGFIDNLLITNDGHLVMVETKLHRNPEAVREAVIQALEYGMAIQRMSVNDLEACLRRGDATISRLKTGESIHAKVAEMPDIRDDFEAALERFLRTGEVLLLVVADGIRKSVERISEWMNENLAGSPIKFGLVELRFYSNGDGSRFVVPKTLLKTIEISRHVVVVDVQNSASSIVQTSVSEIRTGSAASVRTRGVRSASPPMTKEKLLSIADVADKKILQELFDQLESIGYVENTKTASQLRYGLPHPNSSGEFLPVLYFEKNAVWMQPVKALRGLLDEQDVFRMRGEMLPIACFWRPDQMLDVSSSGVAVRYPALTGKIPEMMRVLEDLKRKVNTAYDQNPLD